MARHLYYLTGTSSGIGEALANAVLEDEDALVIGISRNKTIDHPAYQHVSLDLSNLEEVGRFRFRPPDDTVSVSLINNAGWLGEVALLGDLEPSGISRLFDINLSAPAILMNAFIRDTARMNLPTMVMNISSGVGQYPMRSWSGYCASKAGLNMISRVLKEEHPLLDVYSVAPGIVDTGMQEAIRMTDSSKFADKQRFVDYKLNGDLRSSRETALKLKKIIKREIVPENVVCSLRDIN